MSLFKRLTGRPQWFRRALNLYGPFLGAGIRVQYVSPDFREIRVAMKLRWYNRNYVGSHFGGSLYAMTDPFFMLMMMQNLGPAYIVWDKGAEIDFVKPGRGTVTAVFHLTQAQIDEARRETAGGDKFLPCYTVDVTDKVGERVARVHKILYIRKKRRET